MAPKYKEHLMTIKNMFQSWIAFIWPNYLTCNSCEKELDASRKKFLCDACEEAIDLVEGPLCSACSKPVAPVYDQLRPYGYKCKACQENFTFVTKHAAYSHYEGPMKQILMALKYKGKTHHVPYLATCLAKAHDRHFKDTPIDFVVPVPIHAKRQRQRGYNQAALLAETLCKNHSALAYADMLDRIKATPKMKKLTRDQRILTLKDAIELKIAYNNAIKGKNILIVDDIYTTGTTLNACAKVLYEAGADRIYGLTLATGD